jgi:hypothetical protein
MTGTGTARSIVAGVALVWLAGAPAGAETIRNWPCEQPLSEHFSAEQVWGGALPAPLPQNWRDDPTAREVVALAANPENPPGVGETAIAALAESLQAGRQQTLLATYAGLLEEFDRLRGFVVDGVRDFIVRAKILQEAVERNEGALVALPAKGGAAVEEERSGYLAAQAADERNLDDALDEAEFLCRRYGYLGRKLERLTGAIRHALEI